MDIDRFHSRAVFIAKEILEREDAALRCFMVSLLKGDLEFMCDKPFHSDDERADTIKTYRVLLECLDAQYASLITQAWFVPDDPNRPDDPRHRSDRGRALMVMTSSRTEKRTMIMNLDTGKEHPFGEPDFTLFHSVRMPTEQRLFWKYLYLSVTPPSWFHPLDEWPAFTPSKEYLQNLSPSRKAIWEAVHEKNE